MKRGARPPGTITPAHASQIANILKCAAAASIFYYHFFYRLGAPVGFQFRFHPDFFHHVVAAWSWNPAVLSRLLLSNFGYLGVTVFYLVSGWGLTTSHLNKIGEPFSWRQYLVKRALRIYPLYILALLFAALLAHLRGATLSLIGSALVINLLLLQNVLPSTMFWLLGPAWFLPTLAVLYGLFPLLFKQFSRHPQRSLVAALAFTVANQLTILFTPLHVLHPFLLMAAWPLVRLAEFSLGIWFAVMLAGDRGKRAARYGPGVLAFAGAGLLGLGVIGLRQEYLYLQHPLLLVAGGLLLGLSPLSGLASMATIGPLLQTLGKFSYGVFLFHQPLIFWFVDETRGRGFMRYPLATATVLLIALWCLMIPLEKAVRRRESAA